MGIHFVKVACSFPWITCMSDTWFSYNRGNTEGNDERQKKEFPGISSL